MYKMNTVSKGLVSHGVSACSGCGLELIFRNVMDVLGEDTIVVIPPGCSALFSGFGKETAVKIPGFQGNLENTAAYAAGIKAGLEAQGNHHTTVLGFAGDGATIDIGIQALSGMMERRDKVLYICYDNEAYMNTGIQGSSSTPYGANTTTTPLGKETPRKNLVKIAEAHGIPYAATASISNLNDLRRKVKKAKETDGPSLLHIQTPCPTGWHYHPSKSVELAKESVKSGAWVLYEYENGVGKVNYKARDLGNVDKYIKLQGRYKHLSEEELENVKKDVIDNYKVFLGSETE